MRLMFGKIFEATLAIADVDAGEMTMLLLPTMRVAEELLKLSIMLEFDERRLNVD